MPIRHDRRRRVYSDDPSGVSSAGRVRPSGAADNKPSLYTDAARLARQRAVHTLLPARWLTIALAVGTCLLLVGACLSLHVGSDALASLLSAEDAASLRVDAPGSLGDWLSSTLLLIAGAAAMFIYSLRRHRMDDYHGRYRVWIWVCVVCLLSSLVETTSLERLARGMCGLVGDWLNLRNEVLWPSTVGLLTGAMGLRLFFEIRKCPAAVTALAASALSFLFAAALYQRWFVEVTDLANPLLARGSWLGGYVFLLTTFLLYGRHVQLEVEGALSVRTKRNKSKPPAAENDESAIEPPEEAARPALRLRTDLDPVPSSDGDTQCPDSTVGKSSKSTSDNNVASSNSAEPKRHLTRAERRRMRREARMAS